jgi:hypothetical protein
MDLMVEQVVGLAGGFVDSVDVGGPEGVVFVHGEAAGFSVLSSGSGEDDFGVAVMSAAGFEEGEVGAGVDFEVGDGVLHGVNVADLSGEVEDGLLVRDEPGDELRVAEVSDMDRDLILDRMEVKVVAAIGRVEGIHDGDVGAEVAESDGEV